ncbi:MAG: nucleotidyltransferase family protein [Bacteriovoracaceae bacterium]|jgi:hypothetical protein|nr:nucleotidyltransferase family protein [Bacteriovoracaceae bacterium]
MENNLIQIIHDDELMIDILKEVRSLKLFDCWVGAGFIRNKIWDHLHNYKERTSYSDVDIVYFDKSKADIPNFDNQIENNLSLRFPTINWEVVNQAITHKWHKRKPYSDTAEALSEWVETATCVGVRLTEENVIEVIAPHGLDDLFNLVVKPVPTLTNMNTLKNRVKEKEWLKKWPLLKMQISE